MDLPKYHQDHEHHKDKLARYGKPPVHGAFDKAHPIIKPIGYDDADADRQRLATNVHSSFPGIAEFRLVHGHRRAHNAGAYARHEAGDKELRLGVGASLDRCSHLHWNVG